MIEFVKMSGSGNDFVVIDNRNGKVLAEKGKPGFVKEICQRRASIGADGVLLVEETDVSDFRMRYFNADGGEVEFCGNGGRCIAHFAHYELGFPPKVEFDSMAGIVSAVVDGDFVSLKMPLADEPDGPFYLDIANEKIKYYTINTGVPHVVIFVDELENVKVIEIGREIRHWNRFAPEGTNVDFTTLSRNPKYDMEIRTYERGVEDETLACGTGVTAVALTAAKLGIVKLPVRVRVALPDVLTVDRDVSGRPIFSGVVKRIYKGVYRDTF